MKNLVMTSLILVFSSVVTQNVIGAGYPNPAVHCAVIRTKTKTNKKLTDLCTSVKYIDLHTCICFSVLYSLQ